MKLFADDSSLFTRVTDVGSTHSYRKRFENELLMLVPHIVIEKDLKTSY